MVQYTVFFSKIMSQKFIISCWNESVYYRYISFLIFTKRCTACLPVTLYPQYQRKPAIRTSSLSRTSLWKTALSTTENPNTRSFKAAKRRLLQQNLEIRQRCRRSISLDLMLLLRSSVFPNLSLTWCYTSQIYKEVIRKMCVDESLYNLLIEY